MSKASPKPSLKPKPTPKLPAGSALQAPARSEPLRFAAMPTFKLEVLNSITSKHGELLYQRLIGQRILECHVLGVVGHFGPVTLKQTCIEVGIDKGQGSRIVTQLLAAGLLDKRDDPADLRSFYLLLTPAGQRLHDRIAATAATRNERWMQGLPADKRAVFVECLDLLTRRAQEMLAQESARSAGAPDLPLHEQAEPAPDVERPLVVAPAMLRDLQRRLNELLGEAA